MKHIGMCVCVYVCPSKNSTQASQLNMCVCVYVCPSKNSTQASQLNMLGVCVCGSPRTVRRRAAEATKLKCSPLAQLPQLSEMLDLPSSQNNAPEGWCGINRRTE